MPVAACAKSKPEDKLPRATEKVPKPKKKENEKPEKPEKHEKPEKPEKSETPGNDTAAAADSKRPGKDPGDHRGARAKAKIQMAAAEPLQLSASEAERKRKVMDACNAKIAARQHQEKKLKNEDPDQWKLDKLEKEQRDLKAKLKETKAKIDRHKAEGEKEEAYQRSPWAQLQPNALWT